jgi:hypothetical protein
MALDKRMSISRLSLKIADITGKDGPGPRKAYDLVLRGVFPAEFIDGRWYVDEDRISEIAEIWQRHSGADRLVAA